MGRLDASVRATAGQKEKSASASGAGAATSTSTSAANIKGERTPRTSWKRTICIWGLIMPLITMVMVALVPLAFRYARHPAGSPFALITNQTVIDRPASFHSRWRAPDYIDKYDRFFFQWWNYLIYDGETHDHWTLVYHTTKYSKAAQYQDYASVSMVHKQRSTTRETAHSAIPLRDLMHSAEFDLQYRTPDGKIPYTQRIIDDNTYEVVAMMDPSLTHTGQRVSWNLTFHRVHGMYNGLDNEESNKEHCAIVSTLFGYHSKVSGWVQEGDKRYEFTTSGSRYRAYAAGSWGCKLPSGSPALDYPWTWFWMSIPGDAQASPPRPDIGMAMGTALFQTNASIIGDLYGGFSTVGIGEEIITSTTADLHHGRPWQLPLTSSTTDGTLRRFQLDMSDWAAGSDEMGHFQLPTVQRYLIETRRHRFQVDFFSDAEQYFRCPVVVEHSDAAANDGAATSSNSGSGDKASFSFSSSSSVSQAPRRLQVFSDYRAVGVRTHVSIWKRQRAPEERKDMEKQFRIGSKKKDKTTQSIMSLSPLPPPPSILPAESVSEWRSGCWEEVVFEGEASTMNALEYAYESPLSDAVYADFIRKQVIGSASASA